MDFIEELNNLSNRISNYKDKVKGERETINVFVLPFIRILGYDDANPTEVKTEFTADVGIKQGEKVDFAILKDGEAIMLIECKDWSSNLSAENFSQLYRYFAARPEAHIGVLTNGIVYQFYTDLKKENVMDDKPFFELNMFDIQQPLVDVLKNFTKDNFDLDEARTTAINLKLQTEIKGILTEQLEAPTKGFVEFLHNAIEPPRKLEDFTDIVKLAFREFLDEQNEKEPNDGNRSEEEPNGSDGSSLKFTNLRVTFPDGEVIYHHSGKETYLEVLEKLGMKEVMRVRPNIVSTEPFSLATTGVKRGKFWVRGTEGSYGTRGRKAELEKIADRLGVSLLVERVEKTPKSS